MLYHMFGVLNEAISTADIMQKCIHSDDMYSHLNARFILLQN